MDALKSGLTEGLRCRMPSGSGGRTAHTLPWVGMVMVSGHLGHRANVRMDVCLTVLVAAYVPVTGNVSAGHIGHMYARLSGDMYANRDVA